MAEEEEKVVPKEKSSGNLMMIVVVALVGLSMVISVVSLLQVMSINSAIATLGQGSEEDGEGMSSDQISVNDIEIFNFSENFIFIYDDPEDPEVTHNIVVEISVGIFNPVEPTKEQKDIAEMALAATTTLASKEKIIRDGLESMMKTKTYADFQSPEALDMVKADILKYLQDRLVNETIIDVYFNNMLTSSR
jgi:flagellar basal body-associated protein FliL